MKEYEIYVPAVRADGGPLDEKLVDQLKVSLTNAFGGYTCQTEARKGAGNVGGVSIGGDVTILRVLDGETSIFDLGSFKRNLRAALQQDDVLIVCREVSIVM